MDALLLDATLDAIAASARACGEKRTLGQLRADAITAMSLSVLRTSQIAAFSQPAQGISGNRTEGRTGGDSSPARACSPVISTSSCASQGGSDTDVTAGAGPGRLLPDGVPLEGLLSRLSGLMGSTSPWWTPSATNHLPLPAGINVNVTVPLSSLVGLGPPGDGPANSGDPGGGERTDDSELGGRTLPVISGRSLPESGQPLSTGMSALEPAESAQVADVSIGSRRVAVPAMTAWALAAIAERRGAGI